MKNRAEETSKVLNGISTARDRIAPLMKQGEDAIWRPAQFAFEVLGNAASALSEQNDQPTDADRAALLRAKNTILRLLEELQTTWGADEGDDPEALDTLAEINASLGPAPAAVQHRAGHRRTDDLAERAFDLVEKLSLLDAGDLKDPLGDWLRHTDFMEARAILKGKSNARPDRKT